MDTLKPRTNRYGMLQWTALALVAALAAGARAEPMAGYARTVLDTFNRGAYEADITGTAVAALGHTEVGISGTAADAYDYDKRKLNGDAESFSSGGVKDDMLWMYRHASAGHQVILKGTDFPDLLVSASMKWEFHKVEGGVTNTSVKDGHGFWLRKPSPPAAAGSAADAGSIRVWMLASGGFWIQENVSGSGNQVVYSNNPFKTIDYPDNVSHLGRFDNGGPLPATWNGQPFDVNTNGALEIEEPYDLGVRLIGKGLDVLVNGLEVDLNGAAAGTTLALTGDGTVTPTGTNSFSIFTTEISGGRAGTHTYYDDLTVGVPLPPTLLLLACGLAAMCCRRRKG